MTSVSAQSQAPEHYMALALQLAAQGLFTTDPNPRVGCVVVQQGEIVGRGWHQRAGEPHAEVHALREAGERARGATLYVTLEPCSHFGRTPPCADAVINAGVAKVVAAMTDPNPMVAGNGLQRIRDAGIEVQVGVLEAQAKALNPGFVSRMQRGRPWVRCKTAVSLDGRTAMASGASQWITGAAARRDVQRLRARSSAIVTGVGTLLADDPALTVRAEELGVASATAPRQPLRVVADSRLQTPASAKLLQQGGPILIAHCQEVPAQMAALRQAGAELLALPGAQDRIDLQALLTELAARGVNELLVEAGATLSGAFMQAALVDELWVYMAPKLMGSSARPMLALDQISNMQDAIGLQLSDVRQIGDDLRLIYIPN